MAEPSGTPTRRARRTVVTEEALIVSPLVVGRPLAAPWRRGAAISVDVVLCATLANAPNVLFGVAAAMVLLRVSSRRAGNPGFVRRSLRVMSRLGGAVILFVAAIALWDAVAHRLAGNRPASVAVEVGRSTEDGAAPPVRLSGVQAIRFGSGVAGLFSADDPEELGQATTALLESLRDSGMAPEEARNAVEEIAGSFEGKPWANTLVDSVLQADRVVHPAPTSAAPEPLASASAAGRDSLVVAYAAAFSAGDTAAADSLRPTVIRLLSADTVALLSAALSSVGSERDDLREEVAGLEERLESRPGISVMLRALSEDLGVGLGWFGLYFTATTALWHGRTPGKKLLGIRVIGLNGKSIGWWASFERFGGYAAGFATGLLGFAQIFWDDNRQAIHDKIAMTAVIRDRTGRES